MVNIAVFISGTGSGLEAILKASKLGTVPVKVKLVISDRENVKGLVVAENYGEAFIVIDRKNYPSQSDFEQQILDELKQYTIDYIVLAGYMKLIGYMILDKYKVVNVHPSLLPSFPGTRAPKQALDYGCKVTGYTIHWVDKGMDTGRIIYQDSVTIKDDDTEETLWERIKILEHIMYPYIISLLPQVEKSYNDNNDTEEACPWLGKPSKLYLNGTHLANTAKSFLNTVHDK
jgi:phosphoribosylglycinamide formyltransferase-1